MKAKRDAIKAMSQASHVVDDQTEVLRFLASPVAYGCEAEVTRIDTHGAVVFLVGNNAYKIKRAVKFPFMDFSTLEKRWRACEAEARINRVNAPDIYLGTIPVVRKGDLLSLGGSGEILEWVVHMRRFDERETCDRIADRGELTPALIERMANAVVLSQVKAAPRPAVNFTAHLNAIIEGNVSGLNETPDLFERRLVEALTAASHYGLDRIAPLLAERTAGGLVRICHGDLHLRNIVRLANDPVLFDALEFDELMATIDVLYDFAFLLMDVIERGLAHEANYLLNRYLAAWRDERQLSGLAAVPLFVSVRAAIRAKVIAAGLAHMEDDERRQATVTARRYFAVAETALAAPKPQVVGIGGFSGTGKSTIASSLAPDIGCVPGAVHLRSDVERKRLWGVAEFDRLPAAAYEPCITQAVYESLRHQAELTILAGYSVVVDAVHQSEAQRDGLRRLAAKHGVRFTGLWLDAPHSDLVSRVRTRVHDASDASSDTVTVQAERGAGAVDWRRIDARGSPAQVLKGVRDIVVTAFPTLPT